MTTIIAIAVVAVCLFCTYLMLRRETSRMVINAIPYYCGYEDAPTPNSSLLTPNSPNSPNFHKKTTLAQEIAASADPADIAMPKSGKMSLRTLGEWSRAHCTTHHKGATLRNFRTKDFRKKIMHPCVIGGHSECFS